MAHLPSIALQSASAFASPRINVTTSRESMIVATPIVTVVVVIFVIVPVVALPTRPRHFRRRCPRLLRRLIVGVFVIAFVVVSVCNYFLAPFAVTVVVV